MVRTREPKAVRMKEAVLNPIALTRNLCQRSLFDFLEYFWPVVTTHKFIPNWHIAYLAKELEQIAENVGARKPREYDTIINVSPGSTKTILTGIMFPVWCWTKWPWMDFITASYAKDLSLKTAEVARNLIRSPDFEMIFPDFGIMESKDTKSEYQIAQRFYGPTGRLIKTISGGSRYTTSVGGTLTGFHSDIIIVDDPINPKQAASDAELAIANDWMEATLPTRKNDKAITPTILIMQRLHQDDPAGHWLAKEKENLKHISIPGECRNYAKQVIPQELLENYVDDLMDPIRLSWKILDDLKSDLGQYGYAGQIGQNPTPPGGGMFKVDNLSIISIMPALNHIVKSVRYWDKAGTKDAGAYTAGVKMSLISDGRWIIEDVKRGRWGSAERERIIRQTAEADGQSVQIWIEQEGGSGGKESAEGTILNLGGYSVYAERPTGDKTSRADPFSVQVNNGNVSLLAGAWHREFIEELRFFPFSTYKDQCDAASGAFNKLIHKRIAGRVI